MTLGKIITIEGIDGCGKNTQTKLLVQRLCASNNYCIKNDFPRYNRPTGKKIRDYLDGNLGKNLGFEEICRLFAEDRADAQYYDIDFWINFHQTHVINNRYFEANLAYQGAKDFHKRKDIWNFLYKLEIEELGIRPSDFVYVLDIPIECSADAMQKQGRNLDINERDPDYQKKVRECYIELAQIYKDNWKVINCLRDDGKRKSEQELSDELFRIVLADIRKI